MKKSDISKYFSEMAKKRHAKLTKKQRSEMGRKMALARWKKNEKNILS